MPTRIDYFDDSAMANLTSRDEKGSRTIKMIELLDKSLEHGFQKELLQRIREHVESRMQILVPRVR